MRVKDLYTLESRVKDILENDVQARKDDMYLYYKYCETKVNVLTNSLFAKIFYNKGIRILYGISPFVSVDRVRREVQKKYPYLKEKKVAEARYEQQSIYEEYVTH